MLEDIYQHPMNVANYFLDICSSCLLRRAVKGFSDKVTA